MGERDQMRISSTSDLWNPKSRRDFLKMMAVGGSVVFLPGIATGCASFANMHGGNAMPDASAPGSGGTVTIDFAKGDVAVLQFAYALEQLEADFYTRVVGAFGGSDLTAADRGVLADIRNHEVIHRDFLKTALGSNGFSLTPTYPNVNFSSRASVLGTARAFEDLGVAAYNGAGQYLTDVANLTVAGKIVSVEARHAAAIRRMISPHTGEFAPNAFDNVFSPGKVAGIAQGYIIDHLAFANAPTTFVQGPNNNG